MPLMAPGFASILAEVAELSSGSVVRAQDHTGFIHIGCILPCDHNIPRSAQHGVSRILVDVEVVREGDTRRGHVRVAGDVLEMCIGPAEDPDALLNNLDAGVFRAAEQMQGEWLLRMIIDREDDARRNRADPAEE
jgi:hypothetical protein